MKSPKFLRKLAPAIASIALVLSCSSRLQISQNPEPSKQAVRIIYGDLIDESDSDYLMIPVKLSHEGNQDLNILNSSDSRLSKDYLGKESIGYNLIFYHKKTGESHLLLKNKALIDRYETLFNDPPAATSENPPATTPRQPKTETKKTAFLKQFRLFHLIDQDTNDNKRFDREDAIVGYLYNFTDKSLKQITPPNTQVLKWTLNDSQDELFITVRKDSDGNRKFTQEDELDFVRVNLNNPTIGTGLISQEIRSTLETILLK